MNFEPVYVLIENIHDYNKCKLVLDSYKIRYFGINNFNYPFYFFIFNSLCTDRRAIIDSSIPVSTIKEFMDKY